MIHKLGHLPNANLTCSPLQKASGGTSNTPPPSVSFAGPVAGSLALYGYIEWRHGKYNASECRLYLDSLARQIKIQAQEDIDENLED